MYFYRSAIQKPLTLATIYNPSIGGTVRGSFSAVASFRPAWDT